MRLSRLPSSLPAPLSVAAKVVDLISFFTLGDIFTAHITSNLVLATATGGRGGLLNLAQVLADRFHGTPEMIWWCRDRG